MNLSQMYRNRFAEPDLEAKNRVWRVLCGDFFSQFVAEADTVVDVGAGYCEFINNIRCQRKIAIDLNPDVRKFASPDVEVINDSCTNMSSLREGSADVVFMSNFLEHLPSKELVYQTLAEARRILRAGGRVVILQPNIRFLAREYWDFFDHHTPLSDRSLAEVLESLEMRITHLVPRFLPYTTKSRLPNADFLVRAYLKLPFAWRIFGKQALVVAVK